MNNKTKAPDILEAAKRAISEISQDWTPCDEETGRECKGLKCELGPHRAVAILQAAISTEGRRRFSQVSFVARLKGHMVTQLNELDDLSHELEGR